MDCIKCFACQKCVTSQGGGSHQLKPKQNQCNNNCLSEERVREIMLETMIAAGLIPDREPQKKVSI